MKRKLIIALALCLALALGIGGTMAYLTATTTAVVNTFTIGNVGLTLAEPVGEAAHYQFKIVPGETVTKDPTVTVTTGSEPCWLFVKITEDLGALSQYSIDFFDYLTADGWTLVPGQTNVYYRTVGVKEGDSAIGASIPVLKDNKVTLSQNITLDMSKALQTEGAQAPTLTFKAAAVQYDGLTTVETAFAQVPTDF